MSELWAALLGAVIGSLLTALLTTLFNQREQRRQNQIKTTLDLYTEFQNAEMIDSRYKGDTLLKENVSREHSFSFIELSQQLNEEQWNHVSRIIYFFEKLGVLHQLKYLDNELAQQMFKGYFFYYYNRYLNKLGILSEQRDDSTRVGWFQPIKYLATKLPMPEHQRTY